MAKREIDKFLGKGTLIKKKASKKGIFKDWW